MKLLILLAFLVSCGSIDPDVYVAPEFVDYVQEFYDISEKLNVPHRRDVDVVWSDRLDEKTLGVCRRIKQTTAGRTRFFYMVFIDITSLYEEDEYLKKVIYHELVHCSWGHWDHVEDGLMGESIPYSPDATANQLLIEYYNKYVK
jgi:hypothetical protein